ASTPKTSEPPFFGVALVTPLRPGPFVVAPAIPSQPMPSADAPAKPAAAAAPPANSVRRSNFETIGPPFPRTQRTPVSLPATFVPVHHLYAQSLQRCASPGRVLRPKP